MANINSRKIEQEAAVRYARRKTARNSRFKKIEKGIFGSGSDGVEELARLTNRMRMLGMKDEVAEMEEMGADFDQERAQVAYERIIGANDLESTRFLLDGADAARRVGRIVIHKENQLLGYGTGFLISDQLIITNNHVLPDPSFCKASRIQFDYVDDGNGSVNNGQFCGLDASRFFITSEKLDFTIVAIAKADLATVAKRGYFSLSRESGKALFNEYVNIIQHPEGKPQQCAIRSNRIVDVLDDYLHYSADTLPGSSGSAVTNNQWQLAALHHAGVPAEHAGVQIWVANEGVRVSRIVENLDSRKSDLTREQLEMLEAAFKPSKSSCGCHTEKSTDSEQRGPDTQLSKTSSDIESGPKLESDGSVTYTLPVRINIGVGGQYVAINKGRGASGFSGATGSSGSGSSYDNVPKDTELSLSQALEEARRSRERTYYDEYQDRTASNEYYSELRDDLNQSDMFQALSQLVRSTHSQQLGYDVARRQYLYSRVDLREDKRLKSIYSGKGFDVEELIRQEFAIQEQRERRLSEFVRTERVVNEAVIASFMESLEATLPYNCEHVVPQSWFNKSKPMQGDLHHLFTCEMECNSYRSNIPYYEFENEDFREDCGRREEGKFEPVEGKGAVARATLYFLLRYPGIIGDQGRELQRDRLDILLRWHLQERPSLWEKHRNATIFEIQGNRNPLIDHPEWATRIDFRRGFGGG